MIRVSGFKLCSLDRFLVLSLLYLCGVTLVFFNYQQSIDNLPTFCVLFFLTFVCAQPKRAICPLSIFYLYYGLWFVVAPLFANRYKENNLSLPEFTLAFAYAYTVFGIGVLSILFGERVGFINSGVAKSYLRLDRQLNRRLLAFLYLGSSGLVLAIVLSSGGFSIWFTDPGEAFLNRAGSGVYVILSHFFSMALASLSGYYAYEKKSIWSVLFFLTWVMVTSPVHGSKFQIVLLIILVLVPWLRHLRFYSVGTFFLGLGLLAVFFLGLYFRNLTWIDVKTMVPYSLDYFTALENLAISLRDFPPDLMKTFFLPLNKFLTPFGLENSSFYYDMNHLLTDIYFPHAWEIRATEQWPVETDLYLNFYFIFGLPVIGLFLFLIGVIYGFAVKNDSLGAWFAAMLVTLFMVSHLRGSLINHTDFYMYPYIFGMFFLMKRFGFRRLDCVYS
jgi:hypothetical protein